MGPGIGAAANFIEGKKMNDTNPRVAEKLKKWMAAKRPEERLLMCCSMYDTAKALVVASIRERTPDISPNQLRREVFLRFYGSDFNPVVRNKILAWMGPANDSENLMRQIDTRF